MTHMQPLLIRLGLRGAVYSLKKETTQIDSAVEELDKRRQAT